MGRKAAGPRDNGMVGEPGTRACYHVDGAQSPVAKACPAHPRESGEFASCLHLQQGPTPTSGPGRGAHCSPPPNHSSGGCGCMQPQWPHLRNTGLVSTASKRFMMKQSLTLMRWGLPINILYWMTSCLLHRKSGLYFRILLQRLSGNK